MRLRIGTQACQACSPALRKTAERLRPVHTYSTTTTRVVVRNWVVFMIGRASPSRRRVLLS